jgi:hypothetical protein
MRVLPRCLAILLLAVSHAYCQLVLNTGDVWTWGFTNMPNVTTSGGLPGFIPVSSVYLDVSSYDITADVIRCEMLENGLADVPVAVGGRSCSASFQTWSDLQGMVRVTMVAGSVSLDSVTVSRCFGFGVGHYQYYIGCQSQSTVPTLDPQPRLYMTSGEAGDFQFAWSTNYPGCSLEVTEIISATIWQTITNEPTIVGARYSITLPPAESMRYFRLRKN